MNRLEWLVRTAAKRWLSIADYDAAAKVLHLSAVVFLNSLTTFSLWAFIGIWAVQHLRVDHTVLSQTYVTMAVIGILTGWIGGYLSDRQSPRLVFAVSRVIAAAAAFIAPLVDSVALLGLGLITIIAGVNGLIGPIEQRLVPDLFTDDIHERAFAAIGVARQLGLVMAPMLGGLLLLGGWDSLLIGNAAIGLACALVARNVLPDTRSVGARAPSSPIGVLLRDWRFILFFIGTCMGMITYFSYETILPVSLTESHNVAASTWGFFASIPPILTISLQMHLVRLTSGMPIPLKLAMGFVLMGLPLALLSVSSSLVTIALVIVAFAIGTMLFQVSSQTVVAMQAPANLRGAYFGVYRSSLPIGLAMSPLIGFSIRQAYGDATMWAVISLFALLAVPPVIVAVLYRRARSLARSPQTIPEQ